jgi:asparagine synthase (glutamine-hydrolysing)
MCGIVGYLNKNGRPVESFIVNKMTSSLSHRGPHGDGAFPFRNVAIGHRRLAIIDLETGKQPMSNEDDSIWITYNGELYNYKELRKLLLDKGHLFKTNSDTEVIIHAYEEWGKRCVEYFRGMFAFAVLDINREELFIARDHIGIKPLVYFNNQEYFAFSSELQAFHRLPGFDSTINIEALDQYLLLHYIPPPLTIYKHVSKLHPAERMVVGFDGEIKSKEFYWDIKFTPDYSKSEDEWLEELDYILRESIRKHLIADVPVGAFLSGGIDSTIIVKYITELQDSRTLKTFSIGFNEDAYSEIPYSNLVSRIYKTDHYSEIVSHDSINILPQLVKHYGEPFGDDSCIPTYYLSRFASNHVNVVLSGDGGDEFFSGYIAYERWMRLISGEYSDFYKKFPLWKKIAYPFIHHLYKSRYPAKYYNRYNKSIEMWIRHVQTLDFDWKKRLWKDEYQPFVNSVPELFRVSAARIEDLSSVHTAQYMDIKTALPAALLPKVDIASMISGLEVRTPFTDKEVAEFACRIPDSINLRKNNRNSWTGKYLLKQILKNDFDDSFINRRKMGFTPPTLKWFSVNGSTRSLIEERLLDHHAFISEFFKENTIRDLFSHHKIKALWLLLVLELWLEHVHHSN